MLDFCELGSLDNMVRNMRIFNRLVEDNNLLKLLEISPLVWNLYMILKYYIVI